MTDKTKILAEIERLKMNWRLGMSAEAKYRVEAYTELIDFINSIPEEPVSIWHDAQIDSPQAKKKILAINEYGSCEVDYAINMALYWPKVIKWAYIDDLLKLDNSCQSCENLQEEPVSIWHDGCEIPKSETNILMIRKEEKDSNYPPIAGCFHGTNSRLDGRNWGYYNGFCYNEIEPPVRWAYIDDLLKI